MTILLSKPPILQKERKLIGFFAGDVLYGIDIMQVREIVNPLHLIDLPTAPDYVVGVADHRGAVVPVIDLRRRFNLGDTDEVGQKPKWVIVKTSTKDVGILIDRLIGVLKVSVEERRESHPLITDSDAPWICDVYGIEDHLVFELHLDSVVGRAAEAAVLKK